MKRIVSLSLVLTLLLTFTSCSNNEIMKAKTGSEGTNKGVSEKQVSDKFIVGFDAEYPPYGYLAEDGKSYIGFDLDLAREVCKRTGMEFVPQPIDWDSKDLELNAGNIDCIWSGFTINGREEDYSWTIPYVDNSIVIVVNSDSNINTKADLSGKVVMVQAGSSGLAALIDEENAENQKLVESFKSLEQCQDYNSAFMNLESGVIDAVVVDIGVAKYQLNSANGKYKMLNENISSEQYGIGFRKNDNELKNKVENTLKDIWNDGTFMTIANNYSDYSLPDTVCFGDYVR